MTIGGIYMYKNKINGHMYIGYTNNFKRRYSDHKTSAFNKNSKDYNESIHCAIRKYGLNNFDYIYLEVIDDINNTELLKEREKYWIEYYKTYKDRQHYNETPGGDGVSPNAHLIGEKHGMSKITEEDVIMCRKLYADGKRSKDVYNEFFTDKIKYSGFQRMWHGKTWKHIMPEVFKNNPNPKQKYTKKDCEEITKLFKEYNGSLSSFAKTRQCYVGYGTLHKMINNPEFYK